MNAREQIERVSAPPQTDGALAAGAADAFHRRGLAAQAAGNLDEAIRLIDEALRLRPDFSDAYCAGGVILKSCGHAAGALAFYNRALELNPGDALAWYNSGSLLLEHDNSAEALPRLERACALQPANAGAHANRGAALYEQGRLAEAVEAHRRALELDDRQRPARINLGNALMRMGRYAEAREAYLAAIALWPDFALAWCGLGIVAKELGRFDEAMRAYDEALRLEPASEEALGNKGCLQLQLGDFSRGWEGYESRWSLKQRPVPVSSARFDLADPSSVAGRKILVVNDHGLGDTIQFFRYVVLLARAGADVTFAGPPKLRRLLSSAGVTIAWRDEADLSGAFDAALAISSLPRAFATRRDSVPAPVPYLHAEPERSAFWRDQLSGAGPKIGLCWRGSTDFRVDPRRSIPPRHLSSLVKAATAQFVCLQKDADRDELPSELLQRTRVFAEHFDAGADAFLDTAAVMENLDLVITCDTSIAHLAGALGRPVWVALRHVSEWRWMHERTDSPWYPTMRLFRCPEGDDWTTLFEEITAEISRVFGG